MMHVTYIASAPDIDGGEVEVEVIATATACGPAVIRIADVLAISGHDRSLTHALAPTGGVFSPRAVAARESGQKKALAACRVLD